MKKLVICLIWVVGLFLFSFGFGGQANAQGYCTCVVSPSRTCDLQNNYCEDGWHPVCGPLFQCSPVSGNSCNCVIDSNPNENPDCGDRSQPCCPGNNCDSEDLICHPVPRVGLTCLTQEQINQIPGQPPEGNSPIHGDCGDDTINTAIGCVSFATYSELASFFIRWGVGLGGGLMFFLVIFGAFVILTSKGDRIKVQQGKELITAAVAGGVLIVFSVFVFRLIGVDILQLPGFGG